MPSNLGLPKGRGFAHVGVVRPGKLDVPEKYRKSRLVEPYLSSLRTCLLPRSSPLFSFYPRLRSRKAQVYRTKLTLTLQKSRYCSGIPYFYPSIHPFTPAIIYQRVLSIDNIIGHGLGMETALVGCGFLLTNPSYLPEPHFSVVRDPKKT